jgi:DNA-binding NarL/FixJ family response regulator
MKILIVDDHALIRFALSKILLLAPWPEIQILEACNGHQVWEKLAEHPNINVMLMDIKAPEMSGVQLLQSLKQFGKVPATIVLSQFESPAMVSQMIDLGAKGFLLKDASLNELFNAIEAASRNEFYDNDLFQEWRKITNPLSNSPLKLLLTCRDYDLVKYLKQGKSTKEIAASLSLSVHTIETYRKKLLKKTATKNVAELITLLYESGIITNELKYTQGAETSVKR